jgi:hypothetical protein
MMQAKQAQGEKSKTFAIWPNHKLAKGKEQITMLKLHTTTATVTNSVAAKRGPMSRTNGLTQVFTRRKGASIMLKNSYTLFAYLFAFLLALGALPAQAASEVGFEKSATLVRGPIAFGAVDACANKVYVPVKDSDGNLRITGMGLTENSLSNLPQTGNQHVGGKVQEVETTRLRGCNYFVTAVRAQDNTFKLIAWFSGADGFQRLGDSGNHNMAVSEIALASMGVPTDGSADGFPEGPDVGYTIAAVRTGGTGGVFALTSYWVDGGSFDHQDTIIGEAATNIALTSLPPLNSFTHAGRSVVAYRTAQGNLRLAVYDVTLGGMFSLTGDSGNQAGSVEKVAITAYDAKRVMTAVQLPDGTMKLIPWRINDDGTITRLHGVDDPTFNDPTAGRVSEIDIVEYNDSVPGFNDFVVTAVRTAEGNLRLIAWGINSGDIVRLGDSGNLAGNATQIRVAWSNNNQRLVTTLRDSDGNLRVIAWRIY